MRVHRTLAAAGIVAAVLANSAIAYGAVTPGSSFTPNTTSAPAAKSGVSVTASGGEISARPGEVSQSVVPQGVGICGTAFGPPVSDGILSWNDTVPGGVDVTGAADFYCPSSFTITSVDVVGYYGSTFGTATFDVTVYADSSGEPSNSTICSTQGAIGSPTGSTWPSPLLTTIPLTPCNVTAGTYWLEVQEIDPSEPWYWETQATTGGGYDGDWRDRNNSFGTPCSPGYLDGYYMQDCIFGGNVGEPDYMFVLTGDALAACAAVDQITPLFSTMFSAPSMTTTSKGQAADDFTCSGAPPQTPLELRSVSWKGRYTGCMSPNCGPAAFWIKIYTDDPSGGSYEPGTTVCSQYVHYAPGLPPAPGKYEASGLVSWAGPKTFQATLSTPCTLTSGVTYWLSVTAKVGGAVFNWDRGNLGASLAIGSPADWFKKGISCPSWNNGVYMYQIPCLGIPSAKNLFFRIN